MQDLTLPDTFVPIKRSNAMTPSILIRALDLTPAIYQELEDLRSHVRFLEYELMLQSSNKKFKSNSVSEGNVRYGSRSFRSKALHLNLNAINNIANN